MTASIDFLYPGVLVNRTTTSVVRRDHARRSGAVALGVAATLLLAMGAGATPAGAAETLAAPAIVNTPDAASPVLRWAAVDGASAYAVDVAGSSSFSDGSMLYSVQTDNLQATPVVDLPTSTVYYRVRAMDGSTPGTASTGSFVRAVPAAPTPVAPADNAVVDYPAPPVLTWAFPTAGPGWTTERFEVEVDDSSDIKSPILTATTTGSSWAVPAALPFDTARYWHVRGVSPAGVASAWSAPRSFKVTWPAAAAQPKNLLPADDPLGHAPVSDLEFSWDAVAGAKAYDIQVSFSNPVVDASPMLVNARVLGTRFAPQPTLGAGLYSWRVRAVDVADHVSATGWTASRSFRRAWGPQNGPTAHAGATDPLTEAHPVVTPTDAAVPVSRDAFALSWSPVSRAGAYVVQLSTAPNFPDPRNFATPPPAGQQTITCTTYRTGLTLNRATGNAAEDKPFTVTPVGTTVSTPPSVSCDALDVAAETSTAGVVSGRTYYWRVRAVDTPASDPAPVMTSWSTVADPSSPPSFQLADTHDVAQATAGPDVVLESPATDGRVYDAPELRWKPVTGAALYRVQLSLSSSFTTPAATQYTTSTRLLPAGSITENTVGASYWWRVQVCTAVGTCQATTDVWRFHKEAVPATGLVSQLLGDQVRFSWHAFSPPRGVEPDDTGYATAGAQGAVGGYRLQVSSNPGFTAFVGDHVVDQPFFTAQASLYPAGHYFWRVQALDGAGKGLPFSVPQEFDKQVPAPVAGSALEGPAAPTLLWTPSALAKAYEVEVYRGDNAAKAFLPADRELTSGQTVPVAAFTPAALGLEPGVYSWRVRKLDPSGNAGSWNTDDAAVTPPTFQVTRPTALLDSPAAAAVLDPSSRLLSWTPVAGAVHYQVTVTRPGAAPETATTSQTQYAPTAALTAGVTYSWHVTPVNASGQPLTASADRTFSVLTKAAPPSSVALTRDGAGLRVGWSAAAADGGSPVTGFAVRYRPVGSTGGWTFVSPAPPAGARAATLSSLSAGTAYDVQVASVNAFGGGTFGSAAPATTADVPGAPAVTGATAGDGRASLSWSAPAQDGGAAVTGYVATASPGGSTCAVTGLGCTVTGLANGTTYTFTVRATNVVGSSPASAASAAVTPAAPVPPSVTPPGAPTGVTAARGNARVVVRWSAPAGDGGAPISTYVVTAAPSGRTCTTAATTCAVTGLTNGTAYRFSVRAANPAGAGPASSTSAAVTPVGPPGPVRGLKATFPAEGRTVLGWSAPASNGGLAIARYEVRTSVTRGHKWSAWSSVSTARTATLKNHQKGRAYLVEVRAVNGAGTSVAVRLRVKPTR